MGFSYGGSSSPAMCYNGHKNYVLGWYADKQITINPATGGPWLGKLVGFVDYTNASVSRKEYVLIVVGQLYIQYNLAEKFNFQTREKANMVTITTATKVTSPSNILSAMTVNQYTVVGSYTVEVCALVPAAAPVPKYLILSIRLNSQPSSCEATITPITLVPVTVTPTTAVPTSAAPTTKAPTTKAPTTKAPTTKAPTTNSPAPDPPAPDPPAPDPPAPDPPTTNAPAPDPPARSEERRVGKEC